MKNKNFITKEKSSLLLALIKFIDKPDFQDEFPNKHQYIRQLAQALKIVFYMPGTTS